MSERSWNDWIAEYSKSHRLSAPEFLKDWRFLFVGLRWWVAKLRGKA